MPDPHREAGQTIDARRRALAEAVVSRQYELRPALREHYGEGGWAKCVQDTEYHLACLAAAVTFSSPALFRDYVAWAKAALAAHGVAAEDVEGNLACLRDVLSEQLPGGMSEAVAPYVEAALRALPEAPAAPPSFLDGEDGLSELARQFLRALLRGERHEASRLVLDAVRAGVAVGDVYLQVFQRCQREVGRLWQLGQVTVAQEHYCTAATQLAMSQLYPYLFALPKKGRKLVAASVGGELHEVGLRVVTDLFEADGWDTLYLGANLPAGGVVRAVEQHRPELLAVSATMAFHLPGVEQLIALVRSSEAGRGVKVLVGGHPFNVDPGLWERVGADGHATDAGAALDVASTLLGVREPGGRKGRKTYPAGMLPVAGGRHEAPHAGAGVSVYDEMTRLNNELLTAQRELARKNAQLERLNERLAEADRRKDEFLAMLAHELRNPLAPLRNAVHLLRQPGVDRPLIDRTREMMGRQVQQLGRLVDDLLDLSRIARGKMQLRKEWVDLGQVARRAAEASRPLVEARRHELILALPDAPVRLLADPTRLEQVLTNLLNNAARYTPDGGRVWLTATTEGGEAVVRVRDTGIGIPPEMLSGIFGLFAQVERQQERAEGGLGIGLSLVKSLTEMHGGSVEAHSEGPGRGSEFVVRWPLPAEQTPEGARAPAEEAPGAERAVRILLVDDNVDAAESLAMLLRLLGHEVAVAHDGPAALREADAQRPEVVLLDIGMPRMDGYEVARRLRERPGPGQAVLVALTGWGQEEDRRRSREAGFDHHLVKPVELSALQKLLAQVQPQDGGG
jgi:signal transduction histidine kinase/methanogenic corrinoid protein MtbC1/ActR/RegA family two-component response regulator